MAGIGAVQVASAGGGGGSSTITSFLGSTTAGPVNVTQVGGSNVSLGQATMANSIPVAIASNQGAVPASQSGTWTVGSNSAAGSAVPANAFYIAGTNGTNLTPVQMSQPNADGLSQANNGFNVTSYNTVFNGGTTYDRMRSIVNATNSTGTGILASGILAQFDDVSPTSITENQFGNLRMSANRNAYMTIRDAAGNERGVNVNASNQLSVSVDNTPSVTIGANSSVNVNQIGGNAVLTGNGTTGTGSQRVTISSDNTAIANWGLGATGSAVPSGSQYIGGDAATSLPSAASAGNLTGIMVDKFGRQVVLPQGMRDLVSPITQLTLNATTTETTLIGAVASVFLDILSLVIVNTSSTGTQVDFRDSTGGTVRLSVYVPPTDMRGIVYQVPLPQNAVNNNWTAKCGTSVSSIVITGQYISNK